MVSDNERIVLFQQALVNTVNSSDLPLGVKSITLENVLLRVNAAMKDEMIAQKNLANEETHAEQSEDKE